MYVLSTHPRIKRAGRVLKYHLHLAMQRLAGIGDQANIGSFEARVVLRLDRARLPRDWHSYPARPELQQLGDAWLKNATSAVLELPSAIIPTRTAT